MKTSKPLFSIIVPIYNVEKYILKCIDSIISQSFSDFELLIVDDESPDDSVALINANFEDTRIKILSKKNGGLGDARNYGLRHAEGDYVWFLDSDDYTKDSDALLKLQKAILKTKKQTEILVFNMDVVFENSDRSDYIVENASENTEMLTGFDYIDKYNVFPYNVPSQCYKKGFLVDNQFYFIRDLFFEDIYLNLDIYHKARYVFGIKETLYTYNRRDNSITGSQTNSKHLLSQAKVLAKVHKFYKDKLLPNKYLIDRIQIEYDRTKNFYRSFDKLIDSELNVILKSIKIPTRKNETLTRKLEKLLFSLFPILVLKNQFFFRKLNTLANLIKKNDCEK
ncbi:glycosyltransferase family 2 protein [Chryseobacterium oryzae]|uniref:Glycosyltransferase n=1 Tax=Chryseobacterium oryzae TaxID=2929799 RepID=A0ABY4BFU5_9FLAO|nr:glycosyltransferase [Chryseobacterium oryzae]UOE38007.1 glycosyltransferase [Chryseobacterium oryzae]